MELSQTELDCIIKRNGNQNQFILRIPPTGHEIIAVPSTECWDREIIWQNEIEMTRLVTDDVVKSYFPLKDGATNGITDFRR